MFNNIKVHWKRAVSGLLAAVMAVGMLPAVAFAAETESPYAPTGDFELNVAGTTAWNGSDQPLTVYKTEGGSTTVTTIPTNTPFALLEDNGGDRIKIGYVTDGGWIGSTLDGTGWAGKESILVNLPDVIPGIAYERDTSKQFSSRLTRHEYVVPGSYALAEQLAQLQQEAMSIGETMVVRMDGLTVTVGRAKGAPAQMHSYSLDGAVYLKYDAWTEYDTLDADLSTLGYDLPYSIDKAYSADPSITLTKFCPQTKKRVPAKVSASDPTGGVGAYNPGSPGGKKPNNSNVDWKTDQERTFLRFTLIEFPEGVVTDLNTGDWNTWHVVGTPLNVVWSKGGDGETWSADKCRSDITWYNSQAVRYNSMGANAAQLMAGSAVEHGVYSYTATQGHNQRWVTTADEFQAATGISDQEKEQMFHCNSSNWSKGWRDGDYTSMWGTDAESVTPGNLYKVYKANDAFLYLLNRLSETDDQAGGDIPGWSKDEAMEKWSEYVHDADGNLRTKYRIIVETGGIFRDPDGGRRAYTLRDMMAYTLYNNEAGNKGDLIYDQMSTIVNMARWMRQGKDNQFLEYPLDENGTPTGEELHSTNGFRECDSYVDTIQYARPIRDTIFSERRSFGLHIFSPFNFEQPEPTGISLDVTKKTGGEIPVGEEWGFTVSYTVGSPTSYSASKSVTETANGLKFTLKANETIHIDFAADSSFRFEVTEDDTSKLTSITGTGGTADMTTKKFISSGGASKVTFTNGVPSSGKKPVYLKLKKIAKEDQRPLSGAVFSVYADAACSGTVLATMTTGSDGTATTSVPNIVDEGGSVTLYVKETTAPAGCTPLATPFSVTCKDPDNGTQAGAAQVGPAAGIENGGIPTPGKSILFKRDANTNAGVGPATFKFSSVTNGVYEFDTDTSGTLETVQWWDPTEAEGKYIKPGEYAVSEIVPPPNYLPTTEVQQIKLELDADGNPIPAGPLVFKNLAKVGLRVVKYDRLSHKPMNGVTFEIFHNGTSIGRYETKGNGEIVLTGIEPGTYRAVEVDTGDEGHILDTSYQEVELIAGGGTKELVFFNDKKPGMKLVKVDSSDPSKTIPNVKFRIRAIDGSYGPEEFTTNGSGEIDLSMLPEGSYEVTEVECAGYVIDDAQRIIHLKANDTAQFVFTNTKKPGFKLYKTSADGKPLDGVTFKITPVEDASHSIDRTTSNGGEIFVEDLEPGIYSVVETATLPDHVLDKTEYHVELSPGKIAELHIQNDKRPYLTIAKVEQGSGKPIPGTKFTIEGIDSDYRDDVTTGADGTVTIQVDPGSYRITEKDVPEPYCLPEDEADRVQTVSLNPNDNKTLTFKNSKKPLLTISKTDADTGKVVPGTVFEVKGIDNDYQDDWTTGADGKVSQRVNPGTYRVTEKHVPAPYYLPDKDADRVQTISLNPGDEKTLFFKNHRTPELTIYKEDSVAGAPIEGAKFHVTYTSNGESADAPASMDFGYFITDEKGEIRLHEKGKKLYPGEYTVTEVEPAPGFQMKEPTTQKVILHGGESKTLVFQNEPLNAIIVEKYDSVTHEALPGCTFQLRFLGGTSGTGGTIIGQKVTGKNGTCIWTGLTAGTYQVEEIDPADGYSIINSSETVYISDNGTQSVVTVRFDNAPDGILLIRKVCSVNPSITLANAEFKVMYADGTLIGDSNGIYRSDENGEVRIEGLKPGKSVVVTEVKAPSGFIIDTQSQTIQIKEGRTVSLTFKNQPKGKIIIQKRDSQTNEPLSGAQFRVTTAAGCEVGLDGVIGDATLTQNGIFTTDSQGEIRISNLAPGAYVLSEIKAPDGGYVIDNPSTNVVIGPNGDTQTVIITNTKKGGLIIEKYDSVTKQPLYGAQFKVTTASGELVPDNEGLTSSNGLYTTDRNGQIVLSKLLPNTYVVTEERSPDNYRKDPTPQTVVVNAGDTQTLRFYDDPLCTLTILKRDAVTKKPLKGAEFLVRDSAGHLIGPDNGIYTTASDGTVTVSGLTPNSTIIVSEYKAPTGYVKDETPKNIVVRTGVANSLIFDDEPGTTLIIRKFIEGTENEPLSGVGFKVVDGSGAAVGPDDGTYYTDKAGEIVLDGIEPGTTVIAREIKTVDGFVLDGTPQDIKIEAGRVQSLTFWNKRAGTLVIQKKDKVTGALIPGAQFQLTYANGGYVDNDNGHLSSTGLYTTDDKGEIRISGVTGTIVAKEVKAAPNYKIDPATQTQTVTVNPLDTQTLVFYNEPLCSLTITKLDSVKGKPVPGTEFVVKDGDGNILGRYTTGQDGTVVVSGLQPNSTVVVAESRVPDGYVLDTTPQTIVVKSGTENRLTFENDPTTTLIIKKFIEGTENEPLSGVCFKVTDGSGAAVGPDNGEYFTNKAGEIVLGGIEPGATVIAREIKSVEGFVLDGTPQTIKIKAGGAQSLTFWNKRDCSLTILKQSTAKEPLTGAVFLVTDEDGGAIGTNNGRYTSDRNGLVVIPGLQPGQILVVTEEKAPNGFVKDMTPKVIKIKDGANSLIFENAKAGSLVINKRSSLDKKTPLEGVTFKITTSTGEFLPDENGKISSNGLYYTDENGQIILNGIVGTLVVTEQDSIPGYTIHEANRSQTVEIKPDDTQTLYWYNDPLCSLTLTKLDSVSGKPVPNTEFTVKDGNGNIIGRYTTGKDGTVTVGGLIPGSTVVVSESRVPEGYVLDTTPQTIIVKNGTGNSWTSGGSSGGGTGSGNGNDLTFENDPKTTLTIEKYLETETGNQPLKGVTFLVTDSSGAVVGPNNGEYITDENGRIVIANLEPGITISAKEIKVPEGVILDSTPKSIKIKTGEGQTLRFVNKKAGTLVIRKLDKVSKAPLSNVEFELTYAEGGYVDAANGHLSSKGRFKTNDMGEIRVSVTGTVIVKEVTPCPGYVLDETTRIQTITVNPADTQTLVVYNEPLCSLTLTKLDATNGKPVPNTEFTLKDGDGNILGKYTTGADGTVTVTGLIPNSTVVVVESKVPSNYVLDPTPRTIIVRNGSNSLSAGTASGSGTTVGGTGSGNNITVENIPKTTLTIEKVLETEAGDQPLKGVTFLVTDSSGAVVGNSNGEFITDENGRIVISNLEPGMTITAKEIKVPSGVVLDSTPKSIEIKGGEGGQTLRFVNKKAGNLIINKVDGIDKHPLSGVRFKITYADGSNVDQNGGTTSTNGIYTTDANGQIKISGIVGTVVITEIETIDGYYIDEKYRTQTVEINANDTQTITVYNVPTQALVIQKYAADGKNTALAGVEFLVTDSDGTLIGPENGIYRTDQFGRITIKGITPGTVITARETKCLDGFVLDSTPQSIEIKSGEVQRLTFYNSVVGGLELIKVSEADKSQRIKGVTFEIRKMDGALVDTVTTGDNGRVHVSLDAGDYYCVELEAAEGFKIDSTPHYFTVKDNETTTLTVTNAPFSGIILHKIDSVTGLGIYDVKFLVYDQNKNPIGEYSTDDGGYIYIDDLTVQGKGKLFIRELEAAPGYELDKQYKTIYVQPGKTVEIEWKNTPITGQFQIHKFAAEYNEVTGTPAGTPLQGAVYEISEARSGKVVDYITTDARGVAASKPLPLGRYKIVETTAPAYWQVSGTVFDETLEYSGQIIKVSDYDKPSNLGVTITKRGNAETLAGSSMRYDFTVANTSNVPLENFYWHDRIPTDAARATIFTTGTYSARLNYRILYKTNYSAAYQVLASNLITSSNYSFSLNAIPTQAGEYVTDVYLDFGKVPVGFQSVANPTLTVTASGTVANGYQLINRADVGGKYQGTWQTGQATWVTVIRKLTPTYVPKLPKTGY